VRFHPSVAHDNIAPLAARQVHPEPAAAAVQAPVPSCSAWQQIVANSNPNSNAAISKLLSVTDVDGTVLDLIIDWTSCVVADVTEKAFPSDAKSDSAAAEASETGAGAGGAVVADADAFVGKVVPAAVLSGVLFLCAVSISLRKCKVSTKTRTTREINTSSKLRMFIEAHVQRFERAGVCLYSFPATFGSGWRGY
jgi:hypothetical protein